MSEQDGAKSHPVRAAMHRLLNLVTDVSSGLSWAPLLWPFAFFVPFFFLFWLRHYRPRWLGPVANSGVPIAIGLACLVLAAFIAADAAYCLSSAFWDHNEPAVGIQSWMFWRGDAVYQNLLTQQRYSGPYGPYGYIAIGFFQGLIGPSVFATKLLPCLAGAMAMGLFFLVLWRRTSAWLALLFTSLLAALSLRLGPFAFWSRPEPFLLLCVATGLFAATRKGLINTVLLGVSLGIAVDLKISSVCYFLPVVVLAVETGCDWGKLAKAAAIAAVTVILPFIVFPQISLSNYLGILQVIGKRGSGLLEFHLSLEWLVTLFMPVGGGLLFYKLTSSERTAETAGDQKRLLAAIVVASVALLLFASKLGAGPHHFLPLIPIVLLFAAEQTEKGRGFRWHSSMVAVTGYALCFSWLLSCMLVALGSAYSISAGAIRQESEAAASIRDLQQLVDEHPAYAWLGGAPLSGVPVQSPYHLQLVFKGMPPALHPPAQMDFQLAGLAETDLTKLENEIEGKYRKPIAWVVPKGSIPFGMKTAFDQSHPLFSEKFQREFAERFVKAGSSRFFDFYFPR
jgi:hypothetical protein